jgi:hypothetical protein
MYLSSSKDNVHPLSWEENASRCYIAPVWLGLDRNPAIEMDQLESFSCES